MKAGFKSSAFTLWLSCAVVSAVLWPQLASPGGILAAEMGTHYGVWLIFLLLGLSVPRQQFSCGHKPLRLHAFILSWNFIGFPLLVASGWLLLGRWFAVDLMLGFGLLAIMPTTIASAVAFTQLAGGRVAAAVVASLASNLLALLLVPLICMAYLQLNASISLPLQPLILKIASWIVAPLILGQFMQFLLPQLAGRISQPGKVISQFIILFIVHTAFAKSVSQGDFGQLTFATLIGLLSGVLLLLVTVSGLTWWTAGWIGLDRDSRITAFFCASQKSIATGLPLASAVLAAWPQPIDSALILIPLIVYHPLQLLLAGVLLPKMSCTVAAVIRSARSS